MTLSQTELNQVVALSGKLLPTATSVSPAPIAETMPRTSVTTVTSIGTQTSGTMYMFAVTIPAGSVISSASILIGTTAAGTPTHTYMGLYDKNLALLAQSADFLTGAIGASALYTQAMVTPYTTTYTGLHYIAMLSVATTCPTLMGAVSATAGTNIAPILAATSTAGITTGPLPGPAGALTAIVGIAYAFVS